MTQKSANQLWRESNTSLPFKDWIQREKDKGVEIKNKLLEDVFKPKAETMELNAIGDEKFEFGIPKWSIYAGASILAFAIIYKLYKTKK